MRRRALAAAPLALLARPLRAQPTLTLSTAGQGSAFLPYGTGLAAFLARQGISVTVRESAGSLENLARVQDDAAALGLAFLGSAADALSGSPAAGGRVHDRVRALLPMYETSFHVGALRSRNITRIADLAGLRVGAGPARGPAETFLRALLEARGLSVEVVSGTPAELARALAAGTIDALWQGAVVPIPALVEAQGLADVVVFGPSADEVAAVRARLPYMAASATPPGTYRGQEAPILSFAAWNFVIANAALAEETAHALTRAALSAADPRVEIHALAGGTRAENAPANTVIPWHPGAARFHRERGIALPAIG